MAAGKNCEARRVVRQSPMGKEQGMVQKRSLENSHFDLATAKTSPIRDSQNQAHSSTLRNVNDYSSRSVGY